MTIASVRRRSGRPLNQRALCGVETGVHMGNFGDDRDIGHVRTDWLGVLRLATVVSVVAALAAVALSGLMTETTIVVCVIVAATMASWFQIEHPRPAVRRVRLRRH